MKMTLLFLMSFSAFGAYTPSGIPDYTITDTIGKSNVSAKVDVYSATCPSVAADGYNDTLEFTLSEAGNNISPGHSLEILSGSWSSGVKSMVNHLVTINTTAWKNQVGDKVYTIKVRRPFSSSGSLVRSYNLFVRCSTNPNTDHAVGFSQTTDQ